MPTRERFHLRQAYGGTSRPDKCLVVSSLPPAFRPAFPRKTGANAATTRIYFSASMRIILDNKNIYRLIAKMNADKFAGFSECERALLFEALLYCFESNSGIGFNGHCQNRIEYEAASRGLPITQTEDCETTNIMFQLLRELSLHLADSVEYKLLHRRYAITDWQQFCKKALEASEKSPKKYVPLHERTGYYG